MLRYRVPRSATRSLAGPSFVCRCSASSAAGAQRLVPKSKRVSDAPIMGSNPGGERPPRVDLEPPPPATPPASDGSTIAQVDCSFVAELVHRRLEAERDCRHLEPRSSGVRQDPTGDSTDRADQTSTSVDLTTSVPSIETPTVKEGGANTGATRDEQVHGEFSDRYVFLDVRTVGEVTRSGIIEGAKILPMHNLWEALNEPDPTVFWNTYGFEKPSKEKDTLLLYCQHGPRSLMAAQIALYLGFKNVTTLRCGYDEWVNQFSTLCRHIPLDLEADNDDDTLIKDMELERRTASEVFDGVVRAEPADISSSTTSGLRGSTAVLPPHEEREGFTPMFEVGTEASSSGRLVAKARKQMMPKAAEEEHEMLPEQRLTATEADIEPRQRRKHSARKARWRPL